MSDSRPTASESSPRISVIVPTYCRPGAVRRCLAALAEQDYPLDRYEVIVVDDGSEPPLQVSTLGCDRSLNIRVLRQENAGPGAARNHGAATAAGELLAFTDDDCLPEPGWLRAMAWQHIATPDHLLGGKTCNHAVENIYSEASQLILDSALRFYTDHPGPGAFFASNNMAIPAAHFAALHGFNEKFRVASEDRELCGRWQRSGRQLHYVEDAVVRHQPELDFSGFVRKHYRYGMGAFHYHRARQQQKRLLTAANCRTHLQFLGVVAKALSQHSMAQRPKIGILLLFWQGANFVGFLAGAVRTLIR